MNEITDIRTKGQAYYLYDLSIQDIEQRRASRQLFNTGRDVMEYLGITTHQQLRNYTELKKKRQNGQIILYYRTHTSHKYNRSFAIRKVK
ncbi:MAG: hypothetical protein BGO31_00110 [Bacteroidetes bacterium 43-16]|uniref:hypothetical protein n=1 Tax=uncultured Dysgonomonas sp. TaxID=206096 RepID=UPI000928C880|nr:hypothetical protein [uncultured Dysgonomonas sp.]OJV51642.1 MAG: hypothetical protein BGO31_00110 [Bacteroidetes bacterium 43-16]